MGGAVRSSGLVDVWGGSLVPVDVEGCQDRWPKLFEKSRYPFSGWAGSHGAL